MIAEIVSVGTELLMGQVTNTDAQYVAKHLAPLGYKVFYQITVGDNPQRLTEVVKTAFSRADIVIFTGGLGPTDDDLTKEPSHCTRLSSSHFPERWKNSKLTLALAVAKCTKQPQQAMLSNRCRRSGQPQLATAPAAYGGKGKLRSHARTAARALPHVFQLCDAVS